MKTIKDYAKIVRETWHITCMCVSCKMTAIAYFMIIRGEY